MEFTVKIRLGNASMQTNISFALAGIAFELESTTSYTEITDDNGSTVGEWSITSE